MYLGDRCLNTSCTCSLINLDKSRTKHGIYQFPIAEEDQPEADIDPDVSQPADLESLKGETESLNEDRLSYKSVHSQTDPEVEDERPDIGQPEIEVASVLSFESKSEAKQR